MNPIHRHSRNVLAVVCATILSSAMTSCAFQHFWNIREVYTDSTGSNQFIEFFTTSGSQQSVGGHQISVDNGVTTNTFTIPNNLPGDSANKAFLIGTASITNFGSPAPNYVIPDNFIFTNGGTIVFFGANSGAYTSLATDGILSRTWNAGNATNSPQNFAGTVGMITNVNAGSPPSVSITNPPNNTLYVTPATVSVGVSASDSDGTVAEVRLLINGVPAATNSVSPFDFTLASLSAGNYTLRVRAQDNNSLVTTSSPVTVRVTDRPVLTLGTGVVIQFSSRTGINYVVERATPLTNFSSVVTNAGNGGTLQFQETDLSATQRTYRVRLE